MNAGFLILKIFLKSSLSFFEVNFDRVYKDIYILENMTPEISKIVYVFIDASNLWQAQKAKGRMFDYEKLKKYLKERFFVSELKVFYYTAYPAEGTRTFSLDNKHKFFTYLKKGLRFIVRKKELKRIIIHDTVLGDSIQEKGNMDVEMTIDVIHTINQYDIALFFTGDSDFLALINYLRNKNKKVYIFSSKNNISQELRTGSDGYIDVLSIQEDVWGRRLKNKKNVI